VVKGPVPHGKVLLFAPNFVSKLNGGVEVRVLEISSELSLKSGNKRGTLLHKFL
jgi:hypothetical protein